MRRLIARLAKLIPNRSSAPSAPLRTILRLEALEDRSLLSGTFSGVAFVDPSGSGPFVPSEGVPGVTMTLNGKTNTGLAVNVKATTDGDGVFSFANLPAGSYTLQALQSNSLVGQISLANVFVPSGATVVYQGSAIAPKGGTVDEGKAGLAPQVIGDALFLNTASGFPFGPGGSGVNSSIDTPVVRTPLAEIFAGLGANQGVDLAGRFSDTGLVNGTELQFNTSAGTINVFLDDATAPQTVANFLDYVRSGAFNNTIFHRVQNPGTDGLSIIQGGAFALGQNPTSLSQITDPQTRFTVPNEFGGSNVTGTIAMALQSGNINSATDSFFFNTASNASSLDPQSFTVFGRVAGSADQQVLNTLMRSTETNETNATPISSFANIPLNGSPGNPSSGSFTTNDPNFPTDAVRGNFDVINSVTIVPGTQHEALTYTILPGFDPTAITPTLTNEQLSLQGLRSGTTQITVQATDLFGNTATATFTVDVIGVTVTPNNPTATATLTANIAGADPAAALSFQWLKNGTAINGQTGSTLNLVTAGAVTGDRFNVQVTPRLNGVASPPITSGAVTVV
jgi:cyclophilin family peptidyl-prolyl cis-trans isomerase